MQERNFGRTSRLAVGIELAYVDFGLSYIAGEWIFGLSALFASVLPVT